MAQRSISGRKFVPLFVLALLTAVAVMFVIHNRNARRRQERELQQQQQLQRVG